MLLTSLALTRNRSNPLSYCLFGVQTMKDAGPHRKGNLHPKNAHKPMRILPRFLCLGVVVASALSIQAQNQSATRPEPPTPDPVIPEAVLPGVNSPVPAPTQANQPYKYDPLLDLPLLPPGRVTLIGGTVTSLDEVMNQMKLQPFGTKKEMRVHLDTRTRFFRDGAPISEREIKEGQRVYLDTMLNGDRVFAKTIWIRSSVEEGSSRGQIAEVDLQRNSLTVRDELTEQSIKLHISSHTVIRRGTQTGSLSDLSPGALVSLSFGSQSDVREIDLLATPGSVFTFAGQITYLDVSRKLVAIANQSDKKSYDIYVDAIAPGLLRQLREGVNVNVSAVFDGSRYAARSLDFQSASSPNKNK